MGITCYSTQPKKLDAEQIIANINQLFQGMCIRTSDFNKIRIEVRDSIYYKTEENIKHWEKFRNEQISNSEYNQTKKALVASAIEESKNNYKDPNLSLIILLFLANSDKKKFVDALIEVNEVLRDDETVLGVGVKYK